MVLVTVCVHGTLYGHGTCSNITIFCDEHSAASLEQRIYIYLLRSWNKDVKKMFFLEIFLGQFPSNNLLRQYTAVLDILNIVLPIWSNFYFF